MWELFGRELHIIAAPNLCSTNSSTAFSTPTFAGPTAVCHTLSPSPTPLARGQYHWSTPPTRVGSRRTSNRSRGHLEPGIWSYSISRSCTAISRLDKHGSVTLLRHFSIMNVTLRPANFQAMKLERTVCLCLPLPFTITRPATVLSFAARLLCSYPPGRAH